MPQVSRPMLGLLVATVLFFALWLVALKPSSSSSSTSSGAGQYQSAINSARAAVATQNGTNAAAGNTGAAVSATPPNSSVAPTPARPATPATHPATTGAAKPTATAATKSRTGSHIPAAASRHVITPTQRRNVVDRALARHKVLALLFYNPAAADDQAVKQELRAIPSRRGHVVKLAVPLAELARYPVVTNQVVVQTSPTLVIIDRSAQAFSLVGFVDGFEIAQRVDNALSMR